MPQSTFSSINSIIERDKVDTPYKYSLLRAVIESCQEFPQFAKEGEGEFERLCGISAYLLETREYEGF